MGATQLPDHFSRRLDEDGNKYYINKTGDTSWDPPTKDTAQSGASDGAGHGRQETRLPANWARDYDEEGNKFYFHEATGESSWEPPPGAEGGSVSLLAPGHKPSHTVMPEGWERNFTDEGDKYYVDPNGETQWDKPPGN